MRNKGCILVASAVLLLFLGSDLVRRYGPSKARRSLPPSAANISEKWDGLGFFGDFQRILKAKCSKEEFDDFARKVGAETEYDPEIHRSDYGWVISAQAGGPEWWTEPHQFEKCYFKHVPGDDYVLRVKFKDGYLYYFESKW